jgi:hypothetical protein
MRPVDGGRAHRARLPGAVERALPEVFFGVVAVGEAGEARLGVVYLVDAAVGEQGGGVVGADEEGGEGAFGV